MVVLSTKRSILTISLAFAAVFTLSSYWWYTNGDNHLSRLVEKLRPSTPSFPPDGIPNAAPSFAIRDKVAAIIETRPLRNLIPLITHFASVLGPEWPILLFTHASALHTLEALGHGSQPFKRMVHSGQVSIIELPSKEFLGNYYGISAFMASEWFWTRALPAEHMLLFQTDSMICANSGHKVEDFFGYDFIGAAHPYFPGAFNGGLSLRNVSLSMQIVRESNIADDVNELGTKFGMYEDLWFWDKMKAYQARFPDVDTASKFSVDFVWGERPLGYHGVNKTAHEGRLDEIFAWCPEAALAAASNELVVLNSDEVGWLGEATEGETEGGRLLGFG